MKLPIIFRIFKNGQLKEVKQLDQDQIVIGHNADVHLDLDGEGVSAIHCLIEKRDSGYYICDLGSQGGTFKNGQAILDEQIESGDEITIGEFKFQFFVGAPKPKAAPSSSMPAQVAPAKTVVEQVIPVKPEEIKLVDEVTTKIESSAVAAVVAETPVSVNQVKGAASIPASIPELKEEISVVTAKSVTTKPEIKSPKNQSYKKKKSSGTFAPPSEVKDMRSHLKVGKGVHVEVLVIWGDRILDSHHFSKKMLVKAAAENGPQEIALPNSFLKAGFPLLDLRNGVRVQASHDLRIEVKSTDEIQDEVHTNVASRIQPIQAGKSIKLEQNEVVFLSSKSTPLQLAIRFSPQPPAVSLIPPFIFSASEMSALVFAIVLMGLLKFYIDSTIPSEMAEKEQEEVQRVAQVIFNAPDKPKPPPPPEPEPEKPVPPPPQPPKPKPPEKVEMADKTKETQRKGEQTNVATGKNQVAKRAAEVAPKPNSKNRPKSFTSTRQGGAVKTTNTAGANAQSANKDPNNVGLLSAFGSGGVRQKLDKAYSGSGELLGMADRATGTSGFAEDRAGDDLGSRFKDTGAGGKGTATQGISGVGTKGRSSGMSAYGAADGFGNKSSVEVQSGGAEESFVGSIDKEAIRRVIRAKLHEIKSCYERVLNTLPKGQRLEGKVVIKWEIIDRGQARAARVKSTSLRNSAVEACMVSRLQSWVFPEPPENTVADVEYPFVLNQSN
ncbi:MAG: AgmX/PglI C-terminal domain-containing protein [Bdellovibrionia bacterium]